ncbi:uncharacterized protein ARMOST_19040 [Armillaria ostoyae]|uniref:Uncharacterized protein n=1 Tax=Armillaria ostoyae TaxID=47428 RepID=A0A284S3H3_ARMOS|nr:uncharacterized protein ARMOST_19040 [Armillaria ostoyae]
MAYFESLSAEEPIRCTIKNSGVFNINSVPVGTPALGHFCLLDLGVHVCYDGLNGNGLSGPNLCCYLGLESITAEDEYMKQQACFFAHIHLPPPPTMEVPPPDLSQDDKSIIFDTLDIDLNTMILESLLYGLYTGIIAITLWTTFTSTKRLHGTFLHTIIIMLYVLATISFAIDWAFVCHAFIEYNYNYYSLYTALVDHGPWWRAYYLIGGITGGINTLLVDITIIWRCWVLWNYQWQIVLLPIICAIAATIMKTMQILHAFPNSMDNISKSKGFLQNIDWSLVYALLVLATNLMCTLFIVYQIVHFAQRLFLFRSIISALIESSMIYTLALIVYLSLVGRNIIEAYYADVVVGYIRIIAPTLLVLRVAARPTSSSSDEESTDSRPLSDINFQPMGQSSTGSDNSSDQSFLGSHTTESV